MPFNNTGLIGNGTGAQDHPGDNGWSPSPSVVTDEARKVLYITWRGGTGTKPADGYLYEGGLADDIALAMDFGGLKGDPGVGIPGNDGFSPEITVAADTEDDYRLTVKTATGEFTTPNLKGASGTGGTAENIPTKLSELDNDLGFITEADIPDPPDKTSSLQNDSGFITAEDLPKKVSELTNDAGYITLDDIPSGTGGTSESSIAWLPDVSESGDLSWSRSSATEVPETVNIKGTGGDSAYKTWLAEGNTGTEQDFLDSLKGEDGEPGHTPVKGVDYFDGKPGKDAHSPRVGENGNWFEWDDEAQGYVDTGKAVNVKGDRGKAATIEIGTVVTVDSDIPASVVNSGTETAAVLDWQVPKGEKGEPGNTPYPGDNGNWWIGDVDTGIAISTPGVKGNPGADGESLYELWLKAGYKGNLDDCLNWFRHELPVKTGIYGVRINSNDSNPFTCIERTDDSRFGAPLNFGERPCVFKNGEVRFYLNPEDFRYKADGTPWDYTDEAEGDVMIEFPKMAYFIDREGAYTIIKLTARSDAKEIDTRFRFYGHTRNKESDRDKLYIGVYLACEVNGRLRSVFNKTALVNNTITQFRTKAQANGAGYRTEEKKKET